MKNVTIDLPQENCCGCEACVNVCPKDAVQMKPDQFGFKHARIFQDRCIQCHRCEKVCPVLNPSFDSDNKTAIAGYAHDESIVSESSSGGFFTVIADRFLNSGGVVIGVEWNPDFRSVKHVIIDDKKELYRIQKSKYVQSRKENIYNECRELLLKGKRVLFVGCPCEIAALKLILHENYGNLYTIDFVCQGPTSEKAFAQYFDFLEKKYSSKIDYVNMRLSIGPWIPQFLLVKFTNGKKFIDRLYETPLGDAIRIMQRTGCIFCKFNGKHRASDLTLGDYHGAKVGESYYNEAGISIAISHNTQGDELISYLGKAAHVEKADYKELSKYNPCLEEHWPPREGYEIFKRTMSEQGLFAASNAILTKRNNLMRKLPWRIREYIKKAKGRIIH